jgi:hypothetical protein
MSPSEKDCLELRVRNSYRALGLIQKVFLLVQDIVTYGHWLRTAKKPLNGSIGSCANRLTSDPLRRGMHAKRNT